VCAIFIAGCAQSRINENKIIGITAATHHTRGNMVMVTVDKTVTMEEGARLIIIDSFSGKSIMVTILRQINDMLACKITAGGYPALGSKAYLINKND
jgi:hypothetical protein